MEKLKVVYDPEKKIPLGLAGFKKVQIETVGYQTLGMRIANFLRGTGELHSDGKDLEYDQDVGEWTDADPEVDPTNSYMDKIDVFDETKKIYSEAEEIKNKAKDMVVSKVSPSDTQTEEKPLEQPTE